ncbi:MAG TPA: 1,4-alpha-glucan branching protein domain-containing protein [Chloroflexota bacterium]|nr:1,4-alpha-glucan branching protein domain-containing protein [Chloroflexota bacterium]
MKLGAFTFVLHSHLPYCRQAGRWPHGEEWIHEAAAETYVPLLEVLADLAESGVPARLTLGITPVLAEQLADPLVVEHFAWYTRDRAERAGRDVGRFEKLGDRHAAYLASWYESFYRHVLATFTDRFQRSLMGAARQLQESGHLEVLTSAATHGYLPLLSRDSSISAQLQTGVRTYRRHFGRAPRAVWLPECAYRPAYHEGAAIRPGLEDFLAQAGLRLFFAETHTVEGGRPVGKAMEEVIGPYGDIPRRYVVPVSESIPVSERSTFEAYNVARADVAVMGRNNRTGLQVWSAEHGYPGDFDYREFHKKDGVSGLQYWRVTGPRVDLGDKDYYHPDWAEGKIGLQADHFAELVEELIGDYHARTGRYGIVAAVYDTELFGHWWFEGVRWLGEVLRRLAASQSVELSTASGYLERHPPENVVALPESSWGMGGNHFTWENVDTDWMWPLIHEAETRMERLVARDSTASGPTLEVLKQAARELLLLQSSDWPFLITTGQAGEYAIERFNDHHERFERLAALVEAGPADESVGQLAAELYERDKVFADVDYRDWTAR